MKPRSGIALLAAALSLAAAGPAAAKPPASSSTQEARDHYIEGTKLFDLTQYDEAIREFEAAYKARPDPSFLFNIAQAHRLAGHLEKAVRFYRNYLRHSPTSPQRREIEGRIAEIEDALRTQQKQLTALPAGTLGPGETRTSQESNPPQPVPPDATSAQEQAGPATGTGTATATTPPSAPRRGDGETPAAADTAASPGRTLRIAGLAVGIVGVALVGVGIGLGVDGLSSRDQYLHPPAGARWDASLEQRATLNPALGVALGAVGVAAAATGVVLLVRGLHAARGDGAHASLLPVVGRDGAGAALSFTF